MVKNNIANQTQVCNQEERNWSEEEKGETANIEHTDHLESIPSSRSSSMRENPYSQESEDNRLIKLKKTAVGCIIDFLREHSPSPIESIIEYVKSKEQTLEGSKNRKYKKDAFKIVDYALTWYPKLFLLNDHFHYYLNEEEAQKYETKYKLANNVYLEKSKIKYNEKTKKRREKIAKMQKIKRQIEEDLINNTTDPSIITKTYLVLASGNKQAAEDLKMRIRSAYLSFKGINPKDNS